MRTILAGVLCMAIAFACGGGTGGGGGGDSGVPDGTLVVELSTDQRMDLCDFTVEVFGAERTVTCGPDDVRTRGGEDFNECLDDLAQIAADAPMCELTVGQYESCARAVAAQSDEQFCSGTLPAACSPLFSPNCFGA